MARIIKYLAYIAALLIVVVAVYALLFDLPAPQTAIETPVETNLSQ